MRICCRDIKKSEKVSKEPFLCIWISSNFHVLNGTVAGGGSIVNQGTVVRVDLTLSKSAPPFVKAMTVIGSGFVERSDPAALVIGPTAVGMSAR